MALAMSMSGSSSRHCYAVGCPSGDYRLHKWRAMLCDVHGVIHDSTLCDCAPPFQLFPFPTKKTNPIARERWKQALSRAASEHHHYHLEPKACHRVCSEHFIDGKPTGKNPDPIRKPSHTHTSGVKRKKHSMNSVVGFKLDPDISELPDTDEHTYSKSDDKGILRAVNTAARFIIFVLLAVIRKLRGDISQLQIENQILKHRLQKSKSKKTVNTPVNTDVQTLIISNLNDNFQILTAPVVTTLNIPTSSSLIETTEIS